MMVVAMLGKFLDDDTPIKWPVPEMIEPDPGPEMTEPDRVAESSGHRRFTTPFAKEPSVGGPFLGRAVISHLDKS
jgi:hypothetical protein